MEKIFVFAYDEFHANGGFKDFVGRFETIEHAKTYFAHNPQAKKKLLGCELQIIEISEKELKLIALDFEAVEMLELWEKSEIEQYKAEFDPETDQTSQKNRLWLENRLNLGK
jgi:hypothetical protein